MASTPRRHRWTAADIPDQSGRVFVVTGANSGLGLVTARELAAKGAHVVLACRNTEKGEAARAQIEGSTEVRRLDLGDLASVREFAEELSDWRIETLVNNAGLMNTPLGRTADGFETQFGTNVLGHFLLTNLLLGRLTDRVVWLSSMMHRNGRIDLDDLNWERRTYHSSPAYSQTKLADLMLAYELQRRLTVAGSRLRSVAAHPGWTATNLQFKSESPWQDRLWGPLNTAFAQSAEMGALPQLCAATVEDLAGGSYIGPEGPLEMRGHPRPVGSTAASHDREVARRLWAKCEELTGAPFEVTT